ncbi:uncharacterized protein PgNI_06820 [Pyricularia grisea]|uniref:Uncharacterized protein n=1 Tax=Pyricularia grisea TaxID=148305 RepID=A0A6P8B0P1_PYRGI|nr:uncharacterized protein PgNI_06820 [Pyricularia grisea]TLD08475.1 hypothetical protein PgNI_06820 [Pyricularia grisea]
MGGLWSRNGLKAIYLSSAIQVNAKSLHDSAPTTGSPSTTSALFFVMCIRSLTYILRLEITAPLIG